MPMKPIEIESVRMALADLPPAPWIWLNGALYSPGQLQMPVAKPQQVESGSWEIVPLNPSVQHFLAGGPVHVGKLLTEVEYLRARWFILASRAEDGLTGVDALAFVADSLGMSLKELRRALTAREGNHG